MTAMNPNESEESSLLDLSEERAQQLADQLADQIAARKPGTNQFARENLEEIVAKHAKDLRPRGEPVDRKLLSDAFTFHRLLGEFFHHFDAGRLAIGKGLSFDDLQLVRGFVDGARRDLENTNERWLGEDEYGNVIDGNGKLVIAASGETKT